MSSFGAHCCWIRAFTRMSSDAEMGLSRNQTIYRQLLREHLCINTNKHDCWTHAYLLLGCCATHENTDTSSFIPLLFFLHLSVSLSFHLCLILLYSTFRSILFYFFFNFSFFSPFYSFKTCIFDFSYSKHFYSIHSFLFLVHSLRLSVTVHALTPSARHFLVSTRIHIESYASHASRSFKTILIPSLFYRFCLVSSRALIRSLMGLPKNIFGADSGSAIIIKFKEEKNKMSEDLQQQQRLRKKKVEVLRNNGRIVLFALTISFLCFLHKSSLRPIFILSIRHRIILGCSSTLVASHWTTELYLIM